MAKQIIRVEQSDSDKLFREKVNSNFLRVAEESAAPTHTHEHTHDDPDLSGYCTMELYTELEARVRVLESLIGGGGQFTKEGGVGVWMVNGTGAATVRGDVVALDPDSDNKFVLCSGGLDPIGVVYSRNKDIDALCLIIVAGRAQVRLEDDLVAYPGDLLLASDTVDGRAEPATLAGISDADHWREVGHVSMATGGGEVSTVVEHTFTDGGSPPYAVLETPEATWEPIGAEPTADWRWQVDVSYLLQLDELISDVERFTVIHSINAGTLPAPWQAGITDLVSWVFYGQIYDPASPSVAVKGDRSLGNRAIAGGTLGADDWHYEIERIPGTSANWRYRVSYDAGSTWSGWSNLSTGTYTDGSYKCSMKFRCAGTVDVNNTGGASAAPTWFPDSSISVSEITVSGTTVETLPEPDTEYPGLTWAVVHFN